MPTESHIREEFLQMIGAFILEFLETNREMQFDTEAVASFRSDLISQKISHRLYRIVNKLVHNNAESAHCAVYLVNALCRAFSCDQTSQLAVEGDKENAMRLLHNVVDHSSSVTPTPFPSTTPPNWSFSVIGMNTTMRRIPPLSRGLFGIVLKEFPRRKLLNLFEF